MLRINAHETLLKPADCAKYQGWRGIGLMKRREAAEKGNKIIFPCFIVNGALLDKTIAMHESNIARFKKLRQYQTQAKRHQGYPVCDPKEGGNGLGLVMRIYQEGKSVVHITYASSSPNMR